jgi:hypothetical protein
MPLPERVTIKFDVYTLACRALLNRLCDLRIATQADPRLDYDTCLQRFDEALERFFMRANPANRHEAAEQFSALLRAEIDLVRHLSPRAAAVFDDLIATLRNRIDSWHYQQDLELLHQQGRRLAQRFFAASSWPTTQLRRRQLCELLIEYGLPTEDDRNSLFAESFGYRAAPAAYYPCYWDEQHDAEREHIVLVRLGFEHGFGLYLAYPFLFLHEYTAHVHATDYSNEAFNDGWLLHAAAAFMQRSWNTDPDQLGLDLEQVNVFYERLYPRLNPIPRRACRFARDFESWLPDHLRYWSAQITYELAAFQPDGATPPFWPTQALNHLERAFTTDRVRLLAALERSENMQTLLSTLVLS